MAEVLERADEEENWVNQDMDNTLKLAKLLTQLTYSKNRVANILRNTALPMAAYGVKFLAKIFGDFTQKRRNLALNQPEVVNGGQVDPLLINRDNPPDGNFLFGEEILSSPSRIQTDRGPLGKHWNVKFPSNSTSSFGSHHDREPHQEKPWNPEVYEVMT